MAQYGTMGYQNVRLDFQNSNPVSFVLYRSFGGPQDPRKPPEECLRAQCQREVFLRLIQDDLSKNEDIYIHLLKGSCRTHMLTWV